VTNETTLDWVRRKAGVSDPTWSPPDAPEDLGYVGNAHPDWHRTDWPAWVTSVEGFEIGSRWRLTQVAHVVLPRFSRLTLAPGEDPGPSGRYTVEAGAILTLVEVFEPDFSEGWNSHEADWESRTYRIETGLSAGVLVEFSAERFGDRFPFSSRIVHAALVPEGDGDLGPVTAATRRLANRREA
jgi:hypothetical protein